jgi:hypothetical protein
MEFIITLRRHHELSTRTKALACCMSCCTALDCTTTRQYFPGIQSLAGSPATHWAHRFLYHHSINDIFLLKKITTSGILLRKISAHAQQHDSPIQPLDGVVYMVRLVQLHERLHEELHNLNSQTISSLPSSLVGLFENSLSQG